MGYSELQATPTCPIISSDGTTVFFGDTGTQMMYAFYITDVGKFKAGTLKWKTKVSGQFSNQRSAFPVFKNQMYIPLKAGSAGFFDPLNLDTGKVPWGVPTSAPTFAASINTNTARIFATFGTLLAAFKANPGGQDDLDQVWKFDCQGTVQSGPAPSPDGSSIYFICNKALYKVNQNGQQSWKSQLTTQTASDPAPSGNNLVFIATVSDVIAFDASTGATKWSKPYTSNSALASAVVSSDNKFVYSVFTEGTYSKLAALNTQTGFEQTTSQLGLPNELASSPTYASIKGGAGVVVVGCGDYVLRGFDGESGTQKWQSGSLNQCGVDCTGTAPNCLCPVTKNGVELTIDKGHGTISLFSNFKGKHSGSGLGSEVVQPDCSQVKGCMNKNCNSCIVNYWEANPALCLPGCVNNKTDELKQVHLENARVREENARVHEEIARVREENARVREENARVLQGNAMLKEQRNTTSS